MNMSPTSRLNSERVLASKSCFAIFRLLLITAILLALVSGASAQLINLHFGGNAYTDTIETTPATPSGPAGTWNNITTTATCDTDVAVTYADGSPGPTLSFDAGTSGNWGNTSLALGTRDFSAGVYNVANLYESGFQDANNSRTNGLRVKGLAAGSYKVSVVHFYRSFVTSGVKTDTSRLYIGTGNATDARGSGNFSLETVDANPTVNIVTSNGTWEAATDGSTAYNYVSATVSIDSSDRWLTFLNEPPASTSGGDRPGWTVIQIEPVTGCDTATITSDPDNASVEVGQTANFSVGSSGTARTHQWQYSPDTGTSWFDVFNGTGGMTASYTTEQLTTAENNYQYRCIVSVACDSSSVTSAVATVTVNCNTAAITSDPVSTAVDAGQTANFSVTATGSSPTYQWEVSTDSGANFFPDFGTYGTGYDSDSYTTHATTLAENGYQYRCIVTTPCDSMSVTSAAATLTVSCNPAGITSNPVDKAVPEGLTANFSVTATGSAPSYQWELSTDGGTLWSPVGGNFTSYTTPATTSGDNGNKYRCIVSVACDFSSITSSVATLTVVGTDVSFRSAASGSWHIASTWELSSDNGANWFTAGVTPTAANSTNIVISAGTTVTITNADTTVDETVVAGGGTLTIGANRKLIIADGPDTDVTVFGTVNNISTSGSALTLADNATIVIGSGGVLIEDGTSSGWISAGTGSSITFASGGKFQLVKTGGRIPIATWDSNSTCEIAYTVNGSRPDTGYLSQNFGHFTVNCPLNTSGWNLAGQLTNVQGNLTVTFGAFAGAVEFKLIDSGSATYDLNISGDLIVNSGRFNFASAGGPLTVNLTGDLFIADGASMDVSGSQDGSYTLALNSGGTQNYTCNGVNTATKLNWTVNSGTTLNLNSDLPLSHPNRTLTADGTVNLNGNTVIADLLAGSGTIRNQGGGSGLLVLGAGAGNNTVGTLPSLVNGTSGTLGLGKSGSGTLTITDAQTFGGGLVVSNGTALVNNVSGSGTGSGAVTVVNGTLGGNGTIAGSVTVESAGDLAPGNSIEDLTINGTLTLGGTFIAEVNTGASPNTDRVLGTSAVNYGGTLQIDNQGSLLTTSDTFQIFPAGTRSGAFAIVPANPDNNAGLDWDTSTLTTDGTLRIASAGVTPAPAPITFTKISGTELVLTWPSGQGWILEAQTNNSSAVGLSNNWVEIIGADTPYTNNISPATPTTFFRLKYTAP